MMRTFSKTPVRMKQFFIITGMEPFAELAKLQGIDRTSIEGYGKVYDTLIAFGIALMDNVPLPDKVQAFKDYNSGIENEISDYITDDTLKEVMAALVGNAPSTEEPERLPE